MAPDNSIVSGGLTVKISGHRTQYFCIRCGRSVHDLFIRSYQIWAKSHHLLVDLISPLGLLVAGQVSMRNSTIASLEFASPAFARVLGGTQLTVPGDAFVPYHDIRINLVPGNVFPATFVNENTLWGRDTASATGVAQDCWFDIPEWWGTI